MEPSVSAHPWISGGWPWRAGFLQPAEVTRSAICKPRRSIPGKRRFETAIEPAGPVVPLPEASPNTASSTSRRVAAILVLALRRWGGPLRSRRTRHQSVLRRQALRCWLAGGWPSPKPSASAGPGWERPKIVHLRLVTSVWPLASRKKGISPSLSLMT